MEESVIGELAYASPRYLTVVSNPSLSPSGIIFIDHISNIIRGSRVVKGMNRKAELEFEDRYYTEIRMDNGNTFIIDLNIEEVLNKVLLGEDILETRS